MRSFLLVTIDSCDLFYVFSFISKITEFWFFSYFLNIYLRFILLVFYLFSTTSSCSSFSFISKMSEFSFGFSLSDIFFLDKFSFLSETFAFEFYSLMSKMSAL